MIDTCVKGMKGVVRVTIPPNTTEADILSICQNAVIGGSGWKIIDQTANVNRVLFWYHFLFRGQMPVVIMTTSERLAEDKPAGLPGAVRSLSRLGINVVVDASPNSLPPELLSTTRQHVMEVKGLSRDEIRAMPQLKDLFATLDEEHLSHMVLDLLGGIPSLYINLSGELNAAKKSHDTVGAALAEFLFSMLQKLNGEAVTLTTDSPKFDEVLAKLKDRPQIDVEELKRLGLKLPSSCKILRNTGTVVLPTSPMVALYCEYDCDHSKAFEAVLQRIKAAAKIKAVSIEAARGE